MDDNDTTFNSLQFQNPNLSLESDQQQQQHDNDNNEQDDDDGDDEYEDEVEAQLLSTSLLPPGADFTAFPSETLDFVPSSSTMLSLTTDQHAELAVSSSQQQQFPIDVREVNSLCSGGIKEQVGVLKSDISAGVTVPYAGPQTENQLACLQCPTSSELSPTSVTQSSSLTIVEERPTQNSTQYEPVPESDLQKSSDLQAVTIVSIMKTPCPDGYNWRKYGQKQVKSTKGSRSYYKCTYSDCFLKKIECSDHSGGVIETIYKGTHNHEPLRKSSITKESRPVGFSGESGLTAHPIKTLNNLPSSIEHMEEKSSHPESKRLKLMDSGGTNELIRDKQVVEPKPKKSLITRLKKSVPACPGTVLKPDKKPELVVHAASDVGISSDSYRWRKYGQKMVKGNPHPRNYYRCTSAGCPARKHMETAIDNTSALIIAYKGVHDHDVPMKRQSPPSADMVAAVAPLSMSTLQIKSCDSKTNQISSTQRLHDIEVELTPETQNIVGMKSMEPARTVLSVGFEIKPC